MKRITLIILLSSSILSAFGEIIVKSEATVFYSYGLLSADQQSGTENVGSGIYNFQKNGYYLNGQIAMTGEFTNRYDFYILLKTTYRIGSPYEELQLPSLSQSDGFDLELDTLYSRLYLSELFLPQLNIAGAETKVNFKIGKYGVSALDAGISRFGLESVQNKLELPNSLALSLETVIELPGTRQMAWGKRSNLSLELASGGLFDEAVPRLYDTDGTLGSVGEEIGGEYAPQLFARLALNDYVLPFGSLTAGLNYAYNGAEIYSGHSAGAALILTTDIIPEKFQLPLAVSAVYYQKNIDAMADFSEVEENPITKEANTTGFRNIWRAGAALGARLLSGSSAIHKPLVIGDITVSGAFTHLEHVYRETLSVFNLGVDVQYSVLPTLYIGGGFMLGTLNDFVWKTRDGVLTADDDYYHEFNIWDNFGYEAYLGFSLFTNLRFSIGFADLRGLAMNYGLESIQSGMRKARKSGSAAGEGLWETRGIFVMSKISL